MGIKAKTITVNAKALEELLQALHGPGHMIRELQATVRFNDNPINILTEQFNKQVEKESKQK